MIDEEEWDWIVEHTRGSFDHLIVASTLPVFMSHGLHHLESWNEAVCNGVWGRTAARVGERLRRAVDLEHWPAFHDSFERFVELSTDCQPRLAMGEPPATITVLGGDVHTAYVAEVALGSRRRTEPRLPDRLLAISEPTHPVATARRSASPARASPARCSRSSRALAGSLRQRRPGRSSTGRPSTTQSASSSSTSGQHT